MTHILVVDDEILIALLFQDVLAAEGYRVTVAHDGLEALDADAADPADAVVTDLSMPCMGGRDLLAQLRARRPDLPAMVVTGYAGAEDLTGPRTVVLGKPVSPRVLLQRLGGLLTDTDTARGF